MFWLDSFVFPIIGFTEQTCCVLVLLYTVLTKVNNKQFSFTFVLVPKRYVMQKVTD